MPASGNSLGKELAASVQAVQITGSRGETFGLAIYKTTPLTPFYLSRLFVSTDFSPSSLEHNDVCTGEQTHGVVEWGWHRLGEAGRRAGDQQTSVQTLTMALGSSHRTVNKVASGHSLTVHKLYLYG